MVKVFYDFETKNDFIDYLGLIIEQLQKSIWRIKYYNKQVESTCLSKYKEFDPDVSEMTIDLLISLMRDEDYAEKRKIFRPFSYYKYTELDDRLSFVNLKILNIIGDRTKEAVSYRKFLDRINEYNKQGNGEGFIQLSDLNQNIRELLNQCYNHRNYKAHIGDSVFISQKNYRDQQLEVFKENFNFDLKNLKEKMNQYIFVNKYEYVDVEWMFMLYIITTNNIKMYTTIFQQIKRDYSKLVEESMRIQKLQNEVLPYNYSEISLDSFDMQLTKPKNKKK